MKPMYALACTMLLLFGACSDAPETSGSNPSAEVDTEPSPGIDADLASVQAYELTMEGIDKYYEAMKNVRIAMNELSPEKREQLEMELNAEESNSLEDMAASIDRNTLYREALDDAGLSAEEFAILTMSILQSGMAAAIVDMQPNANPDSLIREMHANPKNVAFMRENRDALDAKQQAMEAELEALGISDEE